MPKKDYTIGLDIGTNSVGWAVIDNEFNLAQGKKRIVDKDFSKDIQKLNILKRIFGECDCLIKEILLLNEG